jgi:hypothetical protein
MGQGSTVPASEQELDEAFARIRAAVAAGDTDLSSLGFWRLVKQVKADPSLSERRADTVGAIDRAAFEARVRPRFPVWFGNLVLLAGTAFGIGAVVVALRSTDRTLAGIALVVAGGTWTVSLHDLAHWAVGRLVGIRFTSYFIGGPPPPPRPGLKTDYATYLRAEPGARAWMHASGALATKAAPFIALGFFPASNAPAWAAWALVGMGVLTILSDVLFSRRSGDWKKVIRERDISRARRDPPAP